jgi:hypothetical protein
MYYISTHRRVSSLQDSIREKLTFRLDAILRERPNTLTVACLDICEGATYKAYTSTAMGQLTDAANSIPPGQETTAVSTSAHVQPTATHATINFIRVLGT